MATTIVVPAAATSVARLAVPSQSVASGRDVTLPSAGLGRQCTFFGARLATQSSANVVPVASKGGRCCRAAASSSAESSRDSVLRPFRNRTAFKVIAGLQNFDADNVSAIVVAAEKGGATHVDIACDAELVRLATSLSTLPVCVSSVDPEAFVPAVEAGAHMVEIGNFDSFYSSGRVFAAEEVVELTRRTRQLLPSVILSVTVPHTLHLDEQVALAERLELEGADIIQTEGGTSSKPSSAGVLGLFEKASPTLAAAYSIAKAVKIPVMCASGLSSVTAPLAITAGAAGVGVGSAINKLNDPIAMVAAVRAIADSLGLPASHRLHLPDMRSAEQQIVCRIMPSQYCEPALARSSLPSGTRLEFFVPESMGPAGVTLADEGIEFHGSITPPSSSKTLWLAGHGLADMTIETLQVKFTRLGFYIDPEVTPHLQAWKGSAVEELAEDNAFFTALLNAPVEKCVRIVILKGPVKGGQYGSRLESSIKERLLWEDKLGDEEEKAVDELVEFFRSVDSLAVGSAVIFSWPSSSVLTVSVSEDGSIPRDAAHTVPNATVAASVFDIILGENSQSPSANSSVAQTVAGWLN